MRNELIMTEIQLLQRQDQMAAARAEFKAIWDDTITPRLDEMTLNERVRIEMLCWATFLAAKGLKRAAF
jgi:hypothetical protein